jgi:phospholipase/lecithinase/hemolysin
MRLRAFAGSIAATALILSAFSTPDAASPAPFSRIVVFGASLSDPGNAFALRGGSNTPPDYLLDPFLVPGAPYARGGHHFSNGATWVEQFARSRGLAGSTQPAYGSANPGPSNYAVAGARAYEDGLNVNLSAQVEAFLQDVGGVAPADALYTVEMGGNDLRDALVVYAGGGNGGAILQNATLSIAERIQALYAAGARQFLVWRAPNVGLTPAIRSLGPSAEQLGTALTVAFNQALDGAVAQLSALPGIRIVRLDAFRILNALVDTPWAFGLTNVSAPCISPRIEPFTCQQPDEFLFWDGIHPTKAVHGILAQEAADALAR